MQKTTNKQRLRPIKCIGLASLLLLGLCATAQVGSKSLADSTKKQAQVVSKLLADSTKKQTAVKRNSLAGHQNAFEIGVGSLGVTADFQHRFTKHLAYRIGGTYLPGVSNVNLSDIVSISSQASTTADVSLNSYHLLLEYNPFGGNGFRLIAGVGYFASANGKLLTAFKDSLQITRTKTYSPKEVGVVNTTIDYKCIAPYVGLGLGRGVPKHRFGINLEIGTYYLQAPTVTIVGTNLLANNQQLAPVLQSQLTTYIWLPKFQLNFNFRL